ncbi:VPLPA-CTERM sorting domain-containing protein [Nitrincola sp. A-D6]|nr:VPLPA-CTERM sorting domain-containing protein [Nitrincola sp. A-D6]
MNEVPLPAAAWMFLAGIAGVIGIRRKAARKA